MFLSRLNQKGSSMVEMLGVLAVVSMLGISVIKLVGNVMDMFKQNLVANEVRDLQKAISGRYKFEGNYKELFEGKTEDETINFLCSNKMAPFKMCNGSSLKHSMGGAVRISCFLVSGVCDYTKYVLSFENLSDRTCINVAQINWFSKQKSDIYDIFVNEELVGVLPHNKTPDSDEEILPLSTKSILETCNRKGENIVTWTFY